MLISTHKVYKAPAPAFSLLELMLILAIIGGLVLVGLPSYRSYIVRSQIMEGLALASTTKQKVVEYYMIQGQMPSQNLSLFHQKMNSQAIHSIDVHPGGKVVISFNQIDQVHKPTLVLSPIDHQGLIEWDCTGGSLPYEYRPERCKKE